jgi:hypothetical protein
MLMKVESSNAKSTYHLLPISFVFRNFEQTTNSRSSSLMILELRNVGMPKWAQRPMECKINGLSRFLPKLDPSFDFCCMYPLTDTWDPPFSVSLFVISGVVLTMPLHLLNLETPKPDWYPTVMVPQSFWDFFLSLFGISRTKSLKHSIPKSLPPLLPEPWKFEMPKFHSKDTLCFVTSGFSMQRASAPCHQNFWNAEPRNTKMPKFYTWKIPFVIRELERPRILACTPNLRTPNPRNDLSAQTDHDQQFMLTLDVRVVDSSNS